MKKIVLFAIVLATFGANAQQKLTGFNTTFYDETGATQYIDSSAYGYTSWDGSLFSNEPVFEFEGSVVDWSYNFPAIKWNSANDYSGVSQPLTLNQTWNNTIVGGNATVSESASDKKEFVYDGSGNLTNMKSYYFDGFSFVLSEEQTYEYNGVNAKTVEQYIYHGGGTAVVESIDSLFYDGTNKLIRAISYTWDGVSAFETNSESLITYSGSEINNIKLNNGSPLEWIYDIDYTYAGGMPAGIEGYPVTAGVPDSIVEVEIDYTYNLNDLLSEYTVQIYGDLFVQQDYSYDGQNFVTQITNNQMDFNAGMIYIADIQKFYYQSTAGLNDVVLVDATIFPNPSADFITISTDSKIEHVAIYGVNGMIMLTQKDGNIDISNLPAGTYIAKVKTTTGNAEARFVKQ